MGGFWLAARMIFQISCSSSGILLNKAANGVLECLLIKKKKKLSLRNFQTCFVVMIVMLRCLKNAFSFFILPL